MSARKQTPAQPEKRAADRLRDEHLSARDAAQAELAAAQAKADEAERAERALRRRTVELDKEAREAFVIEQREAGGMYRDRNALAEAFQSAVRNADGAEILSAWCRYRLECARSAGVGVEASPEYTYGSTYAPADFAGDLNTAITRIEAEARTEGAKEVRAYVETYVDKALTDA